MRRAKDFPAAIYYLSPYDGRLTEILVQCTQEIYDADPNSTWKRTFILNNHPMIIQVTNWIFAVLPAGGQKPSNKELAIIGLKWIGSCVAILLLVRHSN